MSQEWRANQKPTDKGGSKAREYTPADWLLQMKLADKRNEKWENRCKKIIRRYRNQHIDDINGNGANQRGMNVLWSNVETLSPSVYGREPVPIAERRFLDQDTTGRVAAQVLERAMRYEMGDCGFHDTVEQSVKDYLLVGRGVAWLRYRPIIGEESSLADRGDDDLNGTLGEPDPTDNDPGIEAEDRDGDEQTEQTPQEKLLAAGIDIDYIHWSNFRTSKARYWREVEWVSREIFMSRDDLVGEFGDEIGEAVPLNLAPEEEELKSGGHTLDQLPENMSKAIVFEIWHKPTRKVYTVAKDFDKYLEEPREDPLNLEGFWPCPKPLFATMTNDTLEPVPDYLEYQDQALQIDELTNRISLLTKALKVAGVYDSANKNLARLLDEGNENKLIPVQNWSQLSEKGGLATAISFVPIKEISDVLMGLVEAREKIKQDMFEITGLADVIRGQSDPRETAAAVKTKGRWGSLRLQARQAAVARFCRDIIRLMGEVISEHYPPELLINVSGAMFDDGIGEAAPEPPQKPDPQPNPLIGHNGGPPMGPGQGSPVPSGPPMVGQQPIGAPPNVGPSPGLGPQPLPPQVQYALAVAQYQQAMQQHLAEKQALIMKAIGLLKQDKMRGFRIDIETDSTVQQEAEQDKQSRVEFIGAVTEFLEKGQQVAMTNPDAIPMLGKMLLFGVRGFRAGRDLESTIEEFVDKSEKDAKAAAGQPKPPPPEVQKEQIALQAVQAKSQAEVAKAKIDEQSSAQDNQREMASKQLDAQLTAEKIKGEMLQNQQEMEFKRAEYEMKMREMQMQHELATREHGNALAVAERMHAHKTEQMETSHKHALEVIRAKPKSEKAA